MLEEPSIEELATIKANLQALADKGTAMEDGFQRYLKIVRQSGIPVPNVAVEMMLRSAFFTGANHVFSAFDLLLGDESEKTEPSEEDVARLANVRIEIDNYIHKTFSADAPSTTRYKWDPEK